jgi:hypothetical protein
VDKFLELPLVTKACVAQASGNVIRPATPQGCQPIVAVGIAEGGQHGVKFLIEQVVVGRRIKVLTQEKPRKVHYHQDYLSLWTSDFACCRLAFVSPTRLRFLPFRIDVSPGC